MKDRGNALRGDSPRHPWFVRVQPEQFAENWERTFGRSNRDDCDKQERRPSEDTKSGR